jgi:hypothetical protein
VLVAVQVVGLVWAALWCQQQQQQEELSGRHHCCANLQQQVVLWPHSSALTAALCS